MRVKKRQTGRYFSYLFLCKVFHPKMSLSLCFPPRVVPQVRLQQVRSLSFSSCLLRCGFLIQWPKVFEPQLSRHSALSHRSLPTSSSCYCGQPSSLVLPATAPFPVLGGRKMDIKTGGETEKERGREPEREHHICQNSSKTLGEAEKAAGSCS